MAQTRNKTKIADDKMALKIPFFRKSSFKICQTSVPVF